MDIPTHSGYSPLYTAASSNYTEIVRALLAAEAVIDVQDDRGETPLYEAGNAEVVKILIDHGVNVNHQNNFGWTPLMMNVGKVNIVKALLDANADLSIQEGGFEKYSALHHAASSGNLDTVKLLLQAGADPMKQNGMGKTAADDARRWGLDEVADFLDRFSKSQGNLV